MVGTKPYYMWELFSSGCGPKSEVLLNSRNKILSSETARFHKQFTMEKEAAERRGSVLGDVNLVAEFKTHEQARTKAKMESRARSPTAHFKKRRVASVVKVSPKKFSPKKFLGTRSLNPFAPLLEGSVALSSASTLVVAQEVA